MSISMAVSHHRFIHASLRRPLHPIHVRSPAAFPVHRRSFSPEARIRNNKPVKVFVTCCYDHRSAASDSATTDSATAAAAAAAAAASPSPSPSRSRSAAEIANLILSAAATATAPDADAGFSFPLTYRLLAALGLLLAAIFRILAAIGRVLADIDRVLADIGILDSKSIGSLLKNLFVQKSLSISPFHVIIYILVLSLIGFIFILLFDLVGFVVEKLDATAKFMDSAVKMIIAINALKKIEMENEKAEKGHATAKFMDSAVKMFIAINALKKIEMENEKAEKKGQEENTA